MKILVFSDSHRSVGGMIDAVEREKPQQIIHLGDIMDDAEDVVQDVFFTIASSHMDILTKIEDPTDLKNYMLKATKNKAISTLRRQKIQKECENKFIDFNLEFNDSVFVESVCAKVEYDELLDAINSSFENSERKTCYDKVDGLVHFPGDQRAFKQGVAVCAVRRVPGFGRFICPTGKDNRIDDENLELLSRGLVKLAAAYQIKK